MIRSLVAKKQIETDEANDKGNSGAPEFVLRRNLRPEDLVKALADGDMVWIDLVDPTSDELLWLEHTLHLSPNVVQDLRREDRRPTLLVYPNYLFLSLFQPWLQRQVVAGREIHAVVGSNYFITVRGANTTTVDEAYNRVANNPDTWLRGVPYFLYLTTQYVVDSYYPLLDQISNQLNSLEERLLSGQADPQARRPVYRTKQQLINLRQMVAPQREVLSNVIGEPRLSGNDDTRDLFRHLYERLLRVYDVIDSQRDLSSTLLDVMDNQESRKLVEVVNRLTIFSMIFLPLTFFTGLFELNFVTTSDPITLPISGQTMFIAVIGLMIFSATAMIYLFRRRGWL
jgi:magnesium transporter